MTLSLQNRQHSGKKNTPRRGIRILGIAMLGLATATAEWGGSEKLAADLRSAPTSETRSSEIIDVIVQCTDAPDEANHAAVRPRGGELKRSFPTIQAAHYRVPVAALEQMAGDPDVAYITPDRPVSGYRDHALPAINGTLVAQVGMTGHGVGIAVIDSGIGYNSDVANNVAYRQSWTGDTDDHFGHGTPVAGVLAGTGANSIGLFFTHTFKGLATSASLISLKVPDSGNGYLDIAAALTSGENAGLESECDVDRVELLRLGQCGDGDAGDCEQRGLGIADPGSGKCGVGFGKPGFGGGNPDRRRSEN